MVIQRAYEALNRFNWSEIELLTYEKEIKRIMDNQAVEDYMKEKARQEGRQEGEKMGLEKGKIEGKIEGEMEKAISIAKAMLKKNYPIEDIMLLTGLSRAQIQDLV